MIKTAIIGASGYTGIELIRLLLEHPQAELVSIGSRTYAGKKLCDVFGNFVNASKLKFTERIDPTVDVVFFCAPNGIAMQQAGEFLEQGKKVIDLSADFRFKDAEVWEQWYKTEHTAKALLKSAVYGLAELHRDAIAQASLVANPGCYATASLLGAYPLVKEGLVGNYLIIDAKSGISGAGRRADVGLLFAETQDNFKAYKTSGHRHFPEIQSQLQALNKKNTPMLSFTPHLLPIRRGILASMYFTTDLDKRALQDVYQSSYANEKFVHVLEHGKMPEVRCVRASNNCHIAVGYEKGSSIAKVFVAIDNLMKGAAGQAIQNFNIMCGFNEAEGLTAIAPLP